jgi:hypothetical protein
MKEDKTEGDREEEGKRFQRPSGGWMDVEQSKTKVECWLVLGWALSG